MEGVTLNNRYGEPFTFQVFDYKLGYSRYPVFTYKLYKTRQDVFDCLIASFKAIGGVPREILFDNMSSVVNRDGNRASRICIKGTGRGGYTSEARKSICLL